MGGHVHGVAVGQRPDLTATKPRVGPIDESGETDPAIRIVFLALLAIDGVISAIGGALFLPAYIGSIPFPVSALVSGLVNTALVWAACWWTTSPRVAALPLWTWFVTVAVMAFGGPGGDVVFGGRGIMSYAPLLLLAAGALPSLAVLLRPRAVR